MRTGFPFGLYASLCLAAATATAGGAGCVGVIGGDDSAGGTSGGTSGGPGGADAGAAGATEGPTSFTCDPAQKGPVEQLRLLTAQQYTNTITDLASWALADPKGGATVLAEIKATAAALQENLPVVSQANPAMAVLFPDGGYLRADQDQQYLRVQAYYYIGNAMGAALTTPARLAKLAGTCATDADAGNDAACLTAFIQKLGTRALRRPLTADDVAFYTRVYGADPKADPQAYADVVAVMLNAPDAVYFVEHGGAPVANQPGVYALSAYELASRLSYHVWDTLPDDALWAAAVDGTLLDDAVYAKHVDRLYADPRAQKAMDRFFLDYMQVDATGGARGKGGLNYRNLYAYDMDPVFKAFAGDDLPAPSLSQNMVDDATAMLDYYAWTTPGTARDLLTSELSFARAADVAKLYGVAAWDGTSAPPQLPAGQRPGLFTRALFTASGVNTSPILKGVFLRRYVLCDAIGTPPAAANGVKVELSPDHTTRDVVTALTANAPCSSCHTTIINPLGFATEGFDGLGRFRTEQTLFHPDGTVAGKLPIDTSTVPRVRLTDDTSKAQNAGDVMKLVADSGKFEACMARNYFRYTFARFEDLTVDGCTLESMRQKLDPTKSPGQLRDLLKTVVTTPAFKRRTFQ
jgi:hypothetical protein